MALNTSSKICISKRLTITALLLAFVGFSVVVFSTLSSSVNKTTSSKAAGAESVVLRDFGGKNQQCAIDLTQDPPNYFCNRDTNLVCDASLDFWLSNITKKAQMRKEDKGPRCVEPIDILRGKEGQPCRKAISGSKQCDSDLVCADVVGDKWPSISDTYASFLHQVKYKDRPKDLENYLESRLHWAVAKYFHIETNPTDNSLIGTYDACVPQILSKVESCGDIGQKACIGESGKPYCFDNNRVQKSGTLTLPEYRCVQKTTINSKNFVRCDDGSTSCNEFCANNNSKCVETCDTKKINLQNGDEQKEVTVGEGGLYEQITDKAVKLRGACDLTYSPGYYEYGTNHPYVALSYTCSTSYNTFCCCDKFK